MSAINLLSIVVIALFVPHFSLAAEKIKAPAKAELDPARIRIRLTFKSEYAKSDSTAALSLANKLFENASEEKQNSVTYYVMLTESIALSIKGRSIDLAMKAARQVDQDFDAPDLIDYISTLLAAAFGGSDKMSQYRPIVKLELSKPPGTEQIVDLGKKWLDIAKSIRTEPRLPLFTRARHWYCEALIKDELKGLPRTEVENGCKVATEEIDKIDSKLKTFSLYEGKWTIKYENKYTLEYNVHVDGTLEYLKAITPEGVVHDKTREPKSKLIRQGNSVIAKFDNGRVIERYSIEIDKLNIDRFDPASLFPKAPNNKGVGIKEK